MYIHIHLFTYIVVLDQEVSSWPCRFLSFVSLRGKTFDVLDFFTDLGCSLLWSRFPSKIMLFLVCSLEKVLPYTRCAHRCEGKDLPFRIPKRNGSVVLMLNSFNLFQFHCPSDLYRLTLRLRCLLLYSREFFVSPSNIGPFQVPENSHPACFRPRVTCLLSLVL